MRRGGLSGGFSLLEMLVVLATLAIVTTLATQAFTEMLGYWSVLRLRAELDARAENVFKQLRADFGSVVSAELSGVSIRGLSRTTQDSDRFWGQVLADDQIVIPARLDVAAGKEPHTGLVMYHVEGRADGSCNLVRTVGDLGSGTPEGATGLVASGVAQLNVEYAPKGSGGWTDTWTAPALPGMVRVSVTLVDEGRREETTRKAVFAVPVN